MLTMLRVVDNLTNVIKGENGRSTDTPTEWSEWVLGS